MATRPPLWRSRLAAVLLTAAMLAGCSSAGAQNGAANQSPSALVAAAAQGLAEAPAVAMHGRLGSTGWHLDTHVLVDASSNWSLSASGTVPVLGTVTGTAEVRAVNGTYYVELPRALWAQLLADTPLVVATLATSLLANRFIELPASVSHTLTTALAHLPLSPSALLDRLGHLNVALTRTGTRVIGGQQAVGIRVGTVATLLVATQGTIRPLALTARGCTSSVQARWLGFTTSAGVCGQARLGFTYPHHATVSVPSAVLALPSSLGGVTHELEVLLSQLLQRFS